MKKFLLGTVALVVLGTTLPALAADLGARRAYTKAPEYMAAPIYNWTGFYIGGHVGGAFVSDESIAGGTNVSRDGQFLGGLQGGADYQFAPNWVVGAEAQYSWLAGGSKSVTFANGGSNFTYSDNQRGLGSVTGRLGYTWGPGLLYVKGGYAFADYKTSLFNNTAGLGVAVNSKDSGYTVGGGLEYMFAQNWSGKIEYQYYDFGNVTFLGTSFKNDEHTVKAGLNYRFNVGGPVVARY
ncbi:MAG: porin family protein [Rhodopseudomonas sp.]|uniref:outer membrane protein n=1 Tax=Rhodopseudomonas sp. TaxID=1078 RepID=UPI00183E9BCE|nr:outer membrane beta-barrel protein [Rhodopseudomonas sp.]NVN85352.1 porin family protein [Rhodopseudomonas sp.]